MIKASKKVTNFAAKYFKGKKPMITKVVKMNRSEKLTLYKKPLIEGRKKLF